MRPLLLLLVVFTAAAFAQRPSVFEGLPGVELSNDKLTLTILNKGGSMANLVVRQDPGRRNPMWNPIRMEKDSKRLQRRSPHTGHFVCVDGFGRPSPQEQAAGLPMHGEAQQLPWEMIESGKEGNTTTLKFRVTLPLVQEVLTRTHRIVDGEHVIYVESELENLMAFDRPVVWAEHATIGAPFLAPEITVVDIRAARSQTRPYTASESARRRLASGMDFTWPMAPLRNGKLADMRTAPVNPDSEDHTTHLMDPERELAYVTALNLEKHMLLGYVFRREEFPWLQIWEDYQTDRIMARGLEFSTQPYGEARRESISKGKMFDTPTYRWLPAKSTINSRFLVFYVPVPKDMKKVDDVRLENGELIIEDRGANQRIVLPASRGL